MKNQIYDRYEWATSQAYLIQTESFESIDYSRLYKMLQKIAETEIQKFIDAVKEICRQRLMLTIPPIEEELEIRTNLILKQQKILRDIKKSSPSLFKNTCDFEYIYGMTRKDLCDELEFPLTTFPLKMADDIKDAVML